MSNERKRAPAKKCENTIFSKFEYARHSRMFFGRCSEGTHRVLKVFFVEEHLAVQKMLDDLNSLGLPW